jgi:protease-4
VITILKGPLMEFQQENNFPGSMQPQQIAQTAMTNTGRPAPERTSRGVGWKIFWGVLLGLSFIGNIILFLMLIGVVIFFATGQRGILSEEVLRDGPYGTKIAVLAIQGTIDSELSERFSSQLKAAQLDKRIKAVIVQVDSPGGTVSASDQIYNEIRRFREKTHKPVIAFMQGTAASGGYYTSVACEKIIAEPTTITGSIGVISSYLVVQQLLEDKLGILPVIIKSGKKKDVPSSFRVPEPNELEYLDRKLIQPAIERFVEVVAAGRKDVLTLPDVKVLADGSIFGAKEALNAKLIDKIGYLDDAIEMVKSLAHIDQAQVVRYRKPFTLTDFLSYGKSNLPKLNKDTLTELGTPQIMYLWSVY